MILLDIALALLGLMMILPCAALVLLVILEPIVFLLTKIGVIK